MTRRTTSPHAGTGRGGAQAAAAQDRAVQIAELLEFHPRMTMQQLADRLHCSIRAVQRSVALSPALVQRMKENAPPPNADGFCCESPSCNQCGPKKRVRNVGYRQSRRERSAA